MLNEIKLMKPKSKDKLAGRDSIQVIVDTKEEILVYSEPGLARTKHRDTRYL